MKKCEECMLHHPERPPEQACSAFGICENHDGDCSLHMKRPENALTVEEFCRRRLGARSVPDLDRRDDYRPAADPGDRGMVP